MSFGGFEVVVLRGVKLIIVPYKPSGCASASVGFPVTRESIVVLRLRLPRCAKASWISRILDGRSTVLRCSANLANGFQLCPPYEETPKSTGSGLLGAQVLIPLDVRRSSANLDDIQPAISIDVDDQTPRG